MYIVGFGLYFVWFMCKTIYWFTLSMEIDFGHP
jgi:hypothetical protein